MGLAHYFYAIMVPTTPFLLPLARLIILGALLNALGLVASLRAQAPVAQAVLKAHVQRLDAMVRRDTIDLAPRLADELQYRHSNGLLEDKRLHIQNVGKGAIVYQRFTPLEEPKVTRYGRVSLLTGVLRVEGLYQGTAFDVKLAFSAFYVKRKKRWLLAAWQSTKL